MWSWITCSFALHLTQLFSSLWNRMNSLFLFPFWVAWRAFLLVASWCINRVTEKISCWLSPSLKDTLRLNLVNLHQLSYNVEWECLEIVTCLGKEESYVHRDYEQWFHRMFLPPFCVWQCRWIVFPGEGTRPKISFASVLFGQLCMDLFLWMGWIFICVSLLFIMVHFVFLVAMDSQRVY